MYPRQHIIFGFIFSIILSLLFPQINFIEFLIIFLSSVLIDIDHYLYYIYRKKDWSLKRSYEWNIKNIIKSSSLKGENNLFIAFSFLHGIEFLVILFILNIFVSRCFLFAFLGVSFHLLLDIIPQIICNEKIGKCSIIYDFLKMREYEKKKH